MQISQGYKWLIAILLFSGLLGLNVLWFVPSPLLVFIMEDLNINLSQAGLSMSIVCLFVALFSIIGGWMVYKIGVKRAFSVGLLFMAAGAIFTLAVDSFLDLFVSRVLTGIGFGLCLPVSGVIIMMWFTETERPYMNTVNSSLPYVATFITFSVTVPLYILLGNSWRMAIGIWGMFLLITALAWAFWGKENNCGEEEEEMSNADFNIYRQVLRDREVRLLSTAEAADMWSFQFLSSMLPTYFVVEKGLDAARAASITAVFPVAGILGGMICGIWMSRIGLRRPFTWPNHLIIFLGTILAINTEGWMRIMGVFLAGFGNAGWAPALFTMPMEFKEIDPAKLGAVYGIIMASGFTSAFISPWLGGWIAKYTGLYSTIFIFAFSSLIAALCTFLMKETGPAIKKVEIVN